MIKPDFPDNEQDRVSALCGLGILDTPPEARFDRITRVVQRHYSVPIALVSLVDSGRQWFKSRQGLDATETARDVSFCGHAILTDKVFYIPDALADPRFADNPLVTGAPFVRFYAGAPLQSADGHRVGTLCIIDHKPREFSGAELEVLRDLADCVEEELKRSDRLASIELMHEQEQRFRSLVDAIVDGIIVIDARGTIQSLNPAAITLFGYTADEVEGKNVKMLMPEPYAAEHDGYLSNYLNTGVRKVIGIGREVTGKRKDGTVFPMELAVSEMKTNGERMFTGIVRDITERKRAQAEIQAKENRIRTLVDTIVDGIIVIDSRGTIQTLNPAAVTLFGYTADEVEGKNVKMLMPEPYAAEHDGYLSNYLNTGVRKIIGIGREVTGKRKDGTTFPMDLAVSEMQIEGERMFTGIVRDITERKRMERMKSEFISTVSHELRTPLTSIRGALSLVMGKGVEQLPEKSRRMLEMAERNSERLTVLINDILDLEKIEAGRLDFEFKEIDLGTLVERSIEDNAGYASRHQVRLVLDRQVAQALVRADENRLLQVLANLISNAVKFSSEQAAVEVSVIARDGAFRVEVRDHGSGIPEEFRDRVFQRFAQADSSDTKGKGGTGLGLSITKAIIERHEGKIGYESEVGVGTVFYFQLPRAGVALRRRASDRQPAAVVHTGVRVLICEDDPDVAQILAAMVQQDGVACDTAGSAATARALLARHAYRLLLLDLTLPDADGLTFLRELRENPDTEQLPVIVVSGRALEGRAAFSGNAVTVVDWIQKPVDRQRLNRALQDALRSAKRPRILHVEDDTDISAVTGALLEDMADLSYVTSLRDARQQLAAHVFDLVILDLGLPDGSGIELLDEIKGRCPVVIFSAQSPGREVTAQVATALTKSMTGNEQLLSTIKNILRLDEGER